MNKPPRALWILAAWLLLIFSTSCFLVPLAASLRAVEQMSPDPDARLQLHRFWLHSWFYIVKGWHATEYAVLTGFVVAALRRAPLAQHWSWPRLVWTAFAFATLFAATDEWHQTFVPGRDGCLRDVCIDMGGALLVALWYLRRLR